MDLPSLTLPFLKETLYAYLAVSKEAVSAVLMTDRKGRQCPVQYVSRTLNEAERNYVPIEKLALSLIRMTRRLRRYFKAHPVKVITDQPIKQILNNTEASGKLAKYVAKEYIAEFKSFSFENIPINKNQKADVLSKLASVAFNYLTKEILVEVLNERSTEGHEVHAIAEEEGNNWMTPMIRCLVEGIWPKDNNKA
ncbi:reverse transcriptase domain-containing protein [Tanacetum coccineum]